jgi:Na+/melibiose symporter-like transporter
MRVKGLELTGKESFAFKIHMIYSGIEGIVMGVLALNEFVLVKSLLGSDYQVAVLTQFSTAVLLFSVIFNYFIKKVKNKKKMLQITAIVTRLPLFAFVLFPITESEYMSQGLYPYVFLGVFLIYFFAQPLILPVINMLLKNAYRHENFGSLYSYASSFNKFIILGSTFGFGMLLDYNAYSFSFIYPVIGVLGVISVFILSRIPYDGVNEEKDNERKAIKQVVRSSMQDMWKVLKNDKPYLHFEVGFMLYGFAWLSTIAVIAIYFVDVLDLNYTSVAFYKNGYNIIAILILPFFGKLLGKIDPRKFAVITFSSLMMYLVFMALTEHFPAYFEFYGIKVYHSLIVSYLFYSVFAATMALLWFIGSAYFCKDEDVALYQSVHLTLTGFRGAFATLIGIFFYEMIGFTYTFGIAIFTLLLSVVLMVYSYRTQITEAQKEE